MAAASPLSPEVLARLLMLQSAAGQLPEPGTIIGFVCRGLEHIPGVQSVVHEPDGAGVTPQPRTERFPLGVARQSHGALVVRLADPDLFRPYAPHVANLSAMIAVVLEERRLRELSETQRREREAQAEEALRESEGRYRRLAANLPDVIWRTDPEGRVLFVNAAVEPFLGYTQEEAVGRPMTDYFPPSSMQRVIAWVTSATARRAKRMQIIGALEYLHKDGHLVPGELHAALVFDEHGRVVSLEGVTRDITERRRADAEREHLEAQLRVSQKMEAVGSLAGGVAHDFNNLLSVILSYAGFVLEALHETDPLREDVEEIRKAGERAAQLTRQLLAFSRKQVLAPEVLDLNAIAADLERMLRRLIGEHIQLVQVLAPNPGPVKADRGQIEQVIMNLVVNARDAMPSGGRLTIETSSVVLAEAYETQHTTVSPGAYTVLAVSDTGHGMDAETQRRLFEPFFTTKEKGKGTGLGLSTAYGIVKQSGGEIVVSSELGRGTTVQVYLPRTTEKAEPAPTHASERAPGGAETILVVEDEDEVRHLTARILRGAGFRVRVARNGDEALAAFEMDAGEIHLLATDVVMPRMSGRQLVDRLRAIRPELRVLYVSGYPDNELLQHGVLPSGTRFMGKPFTAQDLLRKVREALDDR